MTPTLSERTAAEALPLPERFIAWLGRFHPMVVHFPIALLMAALFAEILFAITGDELFKNGLRFTLWGGALGALVTAPLGWVFAIYGTTEQGWLLETHRWAGTTVPFVAWAVLWLNEVTERQHRSRTLLRVGLGVLALLVGSVGFLGGSLLYGIDHILF